MPAAPVVTRSHLLPIAQLVIDGEGRVREGSARAALLLGVDPPGALLGRSLASLLGARPADAVRAHCAAGDEGACEVVARRPDGAAVALGFALASRGPDGELTLHIAELCAAGNGAYADAVQSTLRDAIHGLRNPLAAALNSLDLVQRGLAAPDDLPALSRVTRNGLERIDRMLSGLQDLARAGRGAVSPVAPQEVVREAIARVAPRAASRGVRVVPRGGRRAIPTVRADADSVTTAIEALLENAVDASAEGDEVSVEARWHATVRELHVVVTDRGEGIPPERAPNVFRMFYSSRRSLGVGLSLARWVAAAHGGEVVLTNPPQGGTVATLRLRG